MTLLMLAIAILWATLILVTTHLVMSMVAALKSSKRRRWRKFSSLRKSPKKLLRNGYDKAFIKITHKQSGRFIRFEKYLRLEGYGIALVMLEDWPRDDIETLRRWCEANGLTVRPHDADERTEATFLQVDCGKDAERAYGLASEIWFKIFGFSDDAKFDYEDHYVLPFDELVDNPGHPRLSEEALRDREHEEWKRRHANMNRRNRRLGLPSFSTSTAFALVGVGLVGLVSLIGLVTSTLLAIGEPPDWSATVGTVRVSGSMASLVWSVIYVISFPVAQFFQFRESGSDPFPKNLIQLLMRPLGVAAPVAIVAIWIGG